MSNALKGNNFHVYDKKSGNKIGTVRCGNFKMMANKFKPKAAAMVCFALMMGSVVNLTVHAVDDVVDMTTGVDQVKMATQIAAIETEKAAQVAKFETADDIKEEILENIEHADKALAKIENTDFVSDNSYIVAVDEVAKLKEKMFVEEAVDYLELYEIRELSRDICESILEILNRLSTGNSHSKQLIDDSRNKVVPPDVKNYDKRSIYKVEAVRRGYDFHPKTNNQMVGGRR